MNGTFLAPLRSLDYHNPASFNGAVIAKYIDIHSNANMTNGGPGATLGSLSGYVYRDFNNNGIRETGETGINFVRITLTGTNDLGAVFVETFTDTEGFYHFDDLRPGNYTITEEQPSDFDDGKDTAGTLGGDNSTNDVLASILLGAGQHGVEYNFGELFRE